MQKILLSIITLGSLQLYGAQIVGTQLTVEKGPKASEPYKKNSGVVEFKNYTNEELVIQILDNTGKPLLKDKLYIVPAATGSKQDQLGYIRLQFDSSIVKKPMIIFIYHTELTKVEENEIKAGNTRNSTSLIGRFDIKPNSTRQRFLASIEKPKGGKLMLRPQSSAMMNIGSATVSGIPIKNNVVAKEIGNNLSM